MKTFLDIPGVNLLIDADEVTGLHIDSSGQLWVLMRGQEKYVQVGYTGSSNYDRIMKQLRRAHHTVIDDGSTKDPNDN